MEFSTEVKVPDYLSITSYVCASKVTKQLLSMSLQAACDWLASGSLQKFADILKETCKVS